MNLFNVDFEKLVRQVMPTELRKPRLLALILAMVSPIVRLHGLFLVYRAATFYDLEHNSQVCRMQAVLNDEFDNTDRRIRIVDGPGEDPLYLFQPDELKPVFLYQPSENQSVTLWQEQETIAGADFKILVPAAVAFDPVRMRALTDRYCLPSKDYTIEVI